MPGVSGVTVVTNARVYYTTRGCGRTKRPAFPAPSDYRGRTFRVKLARVRGEIADLYPMSTSLRGAKRRSNPFFLYAAKWIASLTLAMTASCSRGQNGLLRNFDPFSPYRHG